MVERTWQPGEKIYDLEDVMEEGPAFKKEIKQGVIPIDGRLYERPSSPENIYDLTEVIEEPKENMEAMISRIAEEVAEKIAREVIPVVAERVIREEIEKLKRDVL